MFKLNYFNHKKSIIDYKNEEPMNKTKKWAYLNHKISIRNNVIIFESRNQAFKA